MSKKRRRIYKLKRYWRQTFKNKLYAITIVLLMGVLPMIVLKDGTGLVFALCIGIPLFLAKKNVIGEDFI